MYLNAKCLVRSVGGFAMAALLAVPVWGNMTSSATATPGTINYVEGQVRLGHQSLSSKSVAKVEVKPGQSIDTKDGRVEILLTPGVFLRLGQDSSAQMISTSLINTQANITSGEATVEVDEFHPQNNLMIGQDDSTSYIVHTGFYDFDPQQGVMRVLQGQAVVRRKDHHIRVNGGHEVNLMTENGKLKKQKFNKGQYQKANALYRWSQLRSQYLAEANVNAAPYLYSNYGWYGPGGWWGTGWYWNPWFGAYTFVPGGGVLYSPFGWGFYSPWSVGLAPYSVYGGRVRHFDRGFDSWGRHTYRHPYAPRAGHSFGGNREFYRGMGRIQSRGEGGFRDRGALRGGFDRAGRGARGDRR